MAKKSIGYEYFRKYLVNPIPRVDLGLEISKFASSCIDISDGLAKDLKNIAKSSNKGFIVDIDQIPVTPKLCKYVLPKYREECILGGGEDYELCFTANKKYSLKINDISSKLKINISKIGIITNKGYEYLQNGKVIKVKSKGYDHFADS